MPWGPASLQALGETKTDRLRSKDTQKGRRRGNSRREELNGEDGSEVQQRQSGIFSFLPCGAMEKGQDPLEVPVRRGEQDFSLLRTPTLLCQPPANLHPRVGPG